MVEFGDDNGGELKIPATVAMGELMDAAKELDVLNAPVDIPSLLGDSDETHNAPPKYVAQDVIDDIRRFRNLIHPARALKDAYDPSAFTRNELQELKDRYEAAVHSLLFNL